MGMYIVDLWWKCNIEKMPLTIFPDDSWSSDDVGPKCDVGRGQICCPPPQIEP